MTDPEPVRFQGRSGAVEPKSNAAPKRFIRQQIPDDILHNENLRAAMKVLPMNYSFEIMKTIWRIRTAGAKHVALQFPEGLLMYACAISDILESFAGIEEAFVLGDVTYGACCIDDLGAMALGADFLVHYGHSCLVPLTTTRLPCLYVFVEISMDFQHLIATVERNFARDCRLLLAGTIQFSSTLQDRPLSAGETLGCTAPSVKDDAADAILFVADGRFHLEALMIANPTLPAYKYDPYGRVLTREEFDQAGMRAVRRKAIQRARMCKRWGLVLGTLGRQGNPALLRKLQAMLDQAGLEHSLVLLSEVTPDKLAAMPDVEAWVQVACPRLSIDWGEGFRTPTLTPFEAFVALGAAPEWWSRGDDVDSDSDNVGHYPMDYYSKHGGEWNSSYHKAAPRRRAAPIASADG